MSFKIIILTVLKKGEPPKLRENMKFIEDFKEDDRILGHYFCCQKHSLKTKTGKTYYSLKLQDKTGTIDGKVWELNNDIQSFDEKDYIKIDGVVLLYQNSLQLKISKIRKSSEEEYDEKDYIPTTDKNVDTLSQDLEKLIASVNPPIKTLLEDILLKDDFVAKHFKTHSAAKTLHHSYMGGLFEHVVSVGQLCDFLSSRYKHVNRDVLICAALLHDIGKVYELSPFPGNDYTDEGELIGHIVIGVEMVSRAAAKIGIPKEELNLIKHCIISHHGELEFGSPQKPKTIEAMILHAADTTDSKIKMFEEALDKSKNTTWIGYHQGLQRNMRRSAAKN